MVNVAVTWEGSSDKSGKCDNVSATVLFSPLMYVIECSYCNKYSIQYAC